MGGMFGEFVTESVEAITKPVLVQNCLCNTTMVFNDNGFFINSNGTLTNSVNCFFNSDTMGDPMESKGTAKTSAELRQQSTYTGWDFDGVWGINSYINEGYPYLKALVKYNKKTNWQDPKTSEIMSSHISGLQESVRKIEDVLGMSTQSESNVILSEVYVSELDRYRIYQAPEGLRNWLSLPTPIVKVNGTQVYDGFTIDYGGGAVIFDPSLIGTDIVKADFIHIINVSESLEDIRNRIPDGFNKGTGINSVVEGTSTTANKEASHAEGISTVASGYYSHAEGGWTQATGESSHAEGNGTKAYGSFSHTEGNGTKADNANAHAEGQETLATGGNSHAEGGWTVASGYDSHAEGENSQALASWTHAQNRYTIAQGQSQTAIGEYNIAQGTAGSRVDTDYAFIIGNGTSESARSNAFTVDWSGNVVAFGTVISTGRLSTLVSASKTLVKGDRGKLLKCSSGTAITITIPTNASVALPVDSEIVVVRYGTGTVTISPSSGVTLYSSGGKVSINAQYEAVTLKKMATNEWLLLGSLV
jgi:hypothetical protein